VLLDTDIAQYVAIAGAGLGVIGVGVAGVCAVKLRRLRRSYAGVSKAAESGDLLGEIAELKEAAGDLRIEVGYLRTEVARVQSELSDAIRHVAVVRYDAFDDMGGRLSFSAAMLDDSGDGLVLSAIHARSETRSYAKGVKAGVSNVPLSAEEHQAIGHATTRRPSRRSAESGSGETNA
jgi:hypothetical protein